MARREQPAELHMPMPIPTPSSSSSSSSSTTTTAAAAAAAAVSRRLSRDVPTFNASGSLFQRRTSSSKPPRTPSPRSNPVDGQPVPSTSTGLALHTGRDALVGGPVAPASPPFVHSPEQAQATPVDEDGIIRVDTRSRSLSNALNLPASPPTARCRQTD